MAADCIYIMAMSLVQMGYAVMFVISKLTMESGMKPYILITYRQFFSPFFPSLFSSKGTRPRITKSILFRIFFCSIFGATLNPILYFAGLNISTPTIACAIANLIPAMTFILAVIFRLENIRIKSLGGQAKMIGTVACVAGAMLLSFYKGSTIGIPESGIHWRYAEEMMKSHSEKNSNILLGTVLLILSCGSWAIWLIIQAQLSEIFNAPYTSSAIMCLMGSVECGLIALICDHRIDAWSLRSNIRLITILYGGLSSALAFCVISWCITLKGPLYVSVFDPVLLVFGAILSWALLQEKLYVGTVVGSVIIVLCLYVVLWGKKNENGKIEEDKELEIPVSMTIQLQNELRHIT